MSGGDEHDAFGRPVERREEDSAPGGFLPPTERPPEREAWWAGAQAGTIEGRAHGVTVGGGEPAEWPQRAGAAVIDLLVRLGILLVATAIGAVLFVAGEGAGVAGVIAGVVVGGLLGIAYAPWMIAKRNGQTIGHRVSGTRIVKTDGSRVDGGGAFVREVLVKALLFEGILSSFTFFIGTLLNYLWPLWDERNEALHDKMCNTRVVKV